VRIATFATDMGNWTELLRFIIFSTIIIYVRAPYPDDVTSETCMYHQGRYRCWLTHVPTGVDDNPDTPVPLLLDLHGLSGENGIMSRYSGFAEKSDTENFIVVWPSGDDFSWDIGSGCDANFLRMIVSCIAGSNNIDPTRIYMTGHSMGCMMSQQMANQASDLIAAVACAAGNVQKQTIASNYEPVSVMNVHGEVDDVVAYSTAESALETWRVRNNCEAEATETSFTGYTEKKYTNCDGNTTVALISLPLPAPWAHWPYLKGDDACNNCRNNALQGVDTTTLMWDFLKVHSSDADAATIAGLPQCGNTCTNDRGVCSQKSLICDDGDVLDKTKRYTGFGQNLACNQVSLLGGLAKSTCCSPADTNARPACVPTPANTPANTPAKNPFGGNSSSPTPAANETSSIMPGGSDANIKAYVSYGTMIIAILFTMAAIA